MFFCFVAFLQFFLCNCTRVTLFWISVQDDVRNCRHDLLHQVISQHRHSLVIVLHTRYMKNKNDSSIRLHRAKFGGFLFTSISCWAMLQAAPRPTASGVGTVPERRPLSCPPPFCRGSKRTRGLRRTYNAPTPVQARLQVRLSLIMVYHKDHYLSLFCLTHNRENQEHLFTIRHFLCNFFTFTFRVAVRVFLTNKKTLTNIHSFTYLTPIIHQWSANLWGHRSCAHLLTSDQLSSPRHW